MNGAWENVPGGKAKLKEVTAKSSGDSQCSACLGSPTHRDYPFNTWQRNNVVALELSSKSSDALSDCVLLVIVCVLQRI